jgi:hypothetical protein
MFTSKLAITSKKPRPHGGSQGSTASSTVRRTTWPKAALAALLGSLLTTGVAWGAAAWLLPHNKHCALVVGDSMFAGYRLEPGVRFQDWLQRELGASWSVLSFAEAASRPGDFYLQLTEAELLGAKPEVVVIGVSPQKLVPEFEDSSRLNEDGVDLRWLPLDREGYRFYQTLDDHLKQVTAVRKLGLVCGYFEALRAVTLEYVQWPWERRRRAHADPARRQQWIRDRTREIELRWQHADGADKLVRELGTQEARDFAFLVDALHARHVRVVAVMPPGFHAQVLQALSEQARRNLEAVYKETLALCAHLGVSVLDFNAPSERSRFVPEDWDDHVHLGAPRCYHRMARAVQALLDRRAGQERVSTLAPTTRASER